MPRANFCAECGERLAQKGWRARLRARLCVTCSRRIGFVNAMRPFLLLLVTTAASFGLGRYLRPAPPPLIIQRQAASPLSDSPLVFGQPRLPQPAGPNPPRSLNEEGYICGARTRKGTPCKRRVHAAGERCFQHKGLPAMVPPEKLIIRPDNSR